MTPTGMNKLRWIPAAMKTHFYCDAAVAAPPAAKKNLVSNLFQNPIPVTPKKSSTSFDIWELAVMHIR